MQITKPRLNKFISSIPELNSLSGTLKVLFLIFFFTEDLGNTYITTTDLKSLYKLTNMSTPQNFGGELRSLLKSKKLSRTKEGYKLNVRGKEWVKSQISPTIKRPLIKAQQLEYVNYSRVRELTIVNSKTYDLTRLLELLRELNVAFQNNSYLSIPMLVRAVLDHIPPVFGQRTFTEVTNNYGTKSFKDSMVHLDNSSRKIADAFLHTHIRNKESLPNSTQVDFSNDLDVLLSEIYRTLK